ncbi:chromate transporter [Treponema endosymbiont of Eucomonympha sp.]|uniref:chromate transporter n=1 Tax=Treponema endosymbiont of Eucomonympha sp. TaxID=1580831 RepID=UPI000783FB0D|nr:chromate transporter [Treponema endosymbiont of Eucomonympha sp.]
MKEYADLLWTFLKIGCLTFGGGYAMIPVAERELVQKRGWLTMDEVMDYYTIAQITPGIIAVNLSTFVGHKRKGAVGGALTTACFVLPGVCLMTAAALFLRSFADMPVVKHAFAGIRVAVGCLILNTVLKLIRGAFKGVTAAVIFFAAFALSAVWSASPVLLVASAGIAGLILRRPNAGKGNKR